ncbi:cadherin-like and PC-esterase domain-containing protein 1 isoform X3 [Lethenteron reissneri]|uniref:cadherin-like and PC-esterase domain-containing protein 1 isoform X3 n=1 Tax=Lethenteron reissneri TaxID=7753 RepID=UPI002AB6DF5C|nr:cadherin-like and PC-esterase domain-containing protein 1 isoform X3 [Lethenteron reissneri]
MRAQQAEQERLWSTERMLRHLQQAVGHDEAALVLQRVEGVVARTLLAAEARASDAWRCASCFQLLKFILTFDTSLHPLVLQVSGHPSLHVARRPRTASASPPGPDDAPGHGAARSQEAPAYEAVLRDSASLLCAATTGVGKALAGDVRDILERHGVDAEPQSKSYNVEQSACLTGDDLRFLVDTHSESKHSGRFKLLFPSSLPELNAFRSALQHRSREPPFPPSYATDQLPTQLWEDRQAKLSVPTAPPLGDRRSSAIQMQRGSRQADASPAEPGKPDAATGKADANPAGPRNPDAATGKAAQRATIYTANEQLRSNCSNDAEARGVLGSLALEPPLELWPLFEPRVHRYEARAAFPVLLLRLVASARHCEEHVRIGESTGRRGAAHWPLGVGLTQVNVFVMAMGGVARVYTLRVFRDPRPSSSLTRPWNGTVCGLQQDCAFALWDRQPCGLRPLPRGSAQLDEQSPPCQGHEQGSWVLPCLSCADSSSCDWSQAAWEVSGCRHPRFSQQQLQQCMLGVKLLVVGDSTARGMMFYLMERLNGTLAHWEQIHGSKHYRFLNRGLTHAAFAYFPQFWVVPQHQRTFEETVMLLIASSRPLIDGWRTVLLLGGVHWLWPHHLRSLDLLLRREGLSRARVLVKTLSMGFGLPVESTRSLSLSEQRALWQRNVGIVQEARTLGFSIVDTWNVTVARPAEFLPGKCSCHFHEVIPRSRVDGGSALPVTTFHVEGAINAAYSEILLALLCSDQQ